jgi:TrmH family RNA methyltransferase
MCKEVQNRYWLDEKEISSNFSKARERSVFFPSFALLTGKFIQKLSISNNQIKYLTSLQSKKFRKKYKKFVVEGEKMALEAIHHFAAQIDHIFLVGDFLNDWKSIPGLPDRHLTPVSEKELQRISGLKTPNKVLVVCDIPENSQAPVFEEETVLYLDHIKDPGNFGTILRIADWFGWSQIVVSPECAEVWNPKVIQASMGAAFRVKVWEMEIEHLATIEPERKLLVTDMEGVSIFEKKPSEPSILVIGNESHGVDPALKNMAHTTVSIPRAPGSKMESLNAAVATGIILAALKN